MECKLPTCYKSQKKTCSTPNPWIVFNKTHRGFPSKEQKKKAYHLFKEELAHLQKTDSDAYRAALCLYKKKEKRRFPVKAFVQRLMEERKEIEMGCAMPPNLVRFFEQFVPSVIIGTTLNPCQVIAKHLLAKCVRKEDLKYYTVQDKVSSGAHGLLMAGTLKKKPIVIKVIPVHETTPYRLSFTTDHQHVNIKSLSEKNIMREFHLQKRIGDERFDGFQVPAIHGNISIIKSKTSTDRIAVLVMDRVVGEIDMERMTLKQQCHYVSMIPCILHKLHKKGFLHGDLHMWNLLATPTEPYVIDFGRSVHLHDTTITDPTDKIMLTLMDYVIPLEMILRGVDPSGYTHIAGLTRAYMEGMDACPAKKEVDTLFAQVRGKNPQFDTDMDVVMMVPLPTTPTFHSLKTRYNHIRNLLFNKYYSNGKERWYDIMDIQ